MAFSIKLKFILPKKLFADIHVQTAIAQAQRNITRPDLLRMFYDTTEGWKTNVVFKDKQIMNSRRIAMQVFPYGRGKGVYSIVTLGSPAHDITSRRGLLHWQTGYRSATRPGQLMSSSSHRFGSWKYGITVNHPGFQAREFDRFIAEQYYPKFIEDMQEAVNKAVNNR